MKKLSLTFLTLALLVTTIFAQTPNAFKYQAVARDSDGDIISEQAVGFRINILQGSLTGTAVYSETHIPTTNGYGLVNITVGTGTVLSGDITTIEWGTDTYFMEVAMDAAGGTNYTVMGTSQLLSVPYALHAKTVDNPFSGEYSNLTGAPTNVSEFTNDAGYVAIEGDGDITNEIQDISIVGNELTISGANTITLTDNVDDADASATNELQNLSISGNDLTISDGSTVTLTLTDNVDDADIDPANEIQDISIIGHDITITDGSTITIPDNVDDADASITNEIQDISISGDQLTISSGNTITLPDNVDDADVSATNELQNLSISGHDITLTDGGVITIPDNVNDADASVTNELQNAAEVLTVGTDAGNQEMVNVAEMGVGTAALDASAAVELSSNDKGFLPPRMTATQIENIANPAAGLMVYNLTDHTPVYYDGTTWLNVNGSLAFPPQIGDTYAGGIVFYVDGTGHGLVCAPSDQSTGTSWGMRGVDISSGNGADGTAVGTGQANTDAFIAQYPNTLRPSGLCNELDLNGYDDWFLPSKDELGLMYDLKVASLGSFTFGGYWSSSESTANNAWCVAFASGASFTLDKDSDQFVRAVRAF